MTNYAGITFELDTTALNSESVSIDVTVFDENNTAYRSWGNVGHATYVSEDESAKTNADEEIGANTFKKGFKGKVYMPFSVFEKADKGLSCRFVFVFVAVFRNQFSFVCCRR